MNDEHINMTPPKFAELVRDSRLEVAVFADHSLHTCYVPDPQMRRRRARVQERWEQKDAGKLLGSGGFGDVWLEECSAGPSRGQLRAVKGIAKRERSGKKDAAVDYARELEAIAKFSQERVRSGSSSRKISR
jgi:hypothetical protein